MPPPPPAMVGAPEQSIWQKMKMGATMGTMVGLSIGFIFGSFAILRNGAGPRGFFPSLSGYMLSSAATFGFFMSIGSVIRTDGLTMAEWAAQQQANGRLLVGSSVGGNGANAALIREWQRSRADNDN